VKRLAYGEYQVGDYERAFTLSDEVDKDRIQVSVKERRSEAGLAEVNSSKDEKDRSNSRVGTQANGGGTRCEHQESHPFRQKERSSAAMRRIPLP
jgi:hypothetical protein